MSAPALRPDLQRIADWITPQSSVLDLGCGDGTLLAWLARNKATRNYGVEIDVDSVTACVEKGINVIHGNMEAGLTQFEDGAFDFVVLSLTIQAMHNVEGILREMLRVGHTGIVTFPNFGYWENRWQILLGRMPVSETIPYQWYDTPNIHFCTLHDFDALLGTLHMRNTGRVVLNEGHEITVLPNWRGSLAVVRFGKA